MVNYCTNGPPTWIMDNYGSVGNAFLLYYNQNLIETLIIWIKKIYQCFDKTFIIRFILFYEILMFIKKIFLNLIKLKLKSINVRDVF